MPSCSIVIIVRIVADIDPLPAIGGQNVPHAAAIAKAVAKSSAHEKPVAEVRAVQREVGDSGRSNDAGTYNAAVDTDEASVDADEASVVYSDRRLKVVMTTTQSRLDVAVHLAGSKPPGVAAIRGLPQ